MKILSDDFRVAPGAKVKLDRRPTRIDPVYRSKQDYDDLLHRHVHELSQRQQLLYAHDRYALLLVFQAMDAAGKDGAIRHVMSGVNPQGCQVFSFSHPSAAELDHDFLWRSMPSLPERGRIGIFNRSYYEEVLIVRVHPEILRSERLPDGEAGGRKFWKERYRSIVDMESHLHRNGTRIVKFFLHISREEQARRFVDRIDDPDKQWKFNLADMQERAHWNEYMRAYEACLGATSTRDAPWYIVPADDKDNARLLISRIVLDTLKGLKMRYPKADAQRRAQLQETRRQLVKEGTGLNISRE